MTALDISLLDNFHRCGKNCQSYLKTVMSYQTVIHKQKQTLPAGAITKHSTVKSCKQ